MKKSDLRPPSPTCSSTDEYSDSDPDQEPPIIQLPSESSEEQDLKYERPPLDWNDMDPAQCLTWLRENQLPNQKPSKLILTDAQNLSYRQIDRLKKLKDLNLSMINHQKHNLIHSKLRPTSNLHILHSPQLPQRSYTQTYHLLENEIIKIN